MPRSLSGQCDEEISNSAVFVSMETAKKYQIMLLSSMGDGKPRPYSLFSENRKLFHQPLHFSVIIYSLVEQKALGLFQRIMNVTVSATLATLQ